MIQNELWDATLLRIARLTDPPKSGSRQNLTVRSLPPIIADAGLKAEVDRLVQVALDQAAFCRDWRNRHIAHRDLDLALNTPATPLAEARRIDVSNAAAALAAVLNAIQMHFSQSETHYKPVISNGAVSLLYVLDDGLRAREARNARLKSGTPTSEDLGRRKEL
jgi:hypothetical protein